MASELLGLLLVRLSAHRTVFAFADLCAGSAAVAAQSTFGVGAVFSALQSAAMGGYGVPIVAGVVKGGAVVAGAAVGVAAKYGGKA